MSHGRGASREDAGPSTRIQTALRWFLAAVVIGFLGGIAGVALNVVAGAAELLHGTFPWLIFLLPLFGFLTFVIYRWLKIPFDSNTLSVINAARYNKRISSRLSVAILFGTSLTILGDGSVGKEAAALQMGGSLASRIALWFPDSRDGQDMLILCGMAAGFSALLFAPIATAVFALEVSRMGVKKLLRPRTISVFISSFVAFAVTQVFSVGRIWQGPVTVPAVGEAVLPVAVIALLCAVAGPLFVFLLRFLRSICVTFVRRTSARMLIGAVLVIALVCLSAYVSGSGSGLGMLRSDYSGFGVNLIDAALTGEALPADAALWKALLTAVCLSFGYKGGEIMPIFSIGACLGCEVAVLLGAEIPFVAAVGLVALFSSCSHCPLAGTLIGVELFGIAGAPYFLCAAVVACLATRRHNLYDSHDWTLDAPWSHRGGEESTGEHGIGDVEEN